MIRRVAFALLVGGILAPWASAQAPRAPEGGAGQRQLFPPIPPDPSHPDHNAAAHRSILRHNPLPRSTSYQSHYPYQSPASSTQRQSGFANPGGVGRYDEYYDRNTPRSQVDQHPVPVGQFDKGGGPDRQEQIAANRAGSQRNQVLQNTINTYGRPYGAYGAGFGYGLGLSGGRLYGFPN